MTGSSHSLQCRINIRTKVRIFNSYAEQIQSTLTERSVSTDFLLMFAPEKWTSATKFRQFMGPPFNVNRELATGVRSADNHLTKFFVLTGLANRLRTQLPKDEVELEERGYSSASRSKEYAALVESLFCELYASLGGIRRTLFAAYENVQGVQNKSTEKLFKRAKDNGYGSGFPTDIRNTLSSAYDSWFSRLRKIRTEVTHGDIGSCHLDKQTGKVFYMHGGLGSGTTACVIEDVETELNLLAESVATLIETIFASLCSKLQPVERRIVCGFYKGRCYERLVRFTPNLSFNDGRCASLTWFANESGYECPMRNNCGAYRNAIDTGKDCA